MQIPLEDAYAAACQKLGEVTVKEALLTDLLAMRDAEIESLKEKLQAAGVIEEATEIVEGSDAIPTDEQRGLQQHEQVPGGSSE